MKNLPATFHKTVCFKLASFLLLIVFTGLSSFGQSFNPDKNYFVAAALGYNFSAAGGNMGSNNTNDGISGIYGFWGQGMLANAAVGMETCDNLYTLLSVNYLNGRNIKSSTIYDYPTSKYHENNTNHLRIPLLITLGGRYYLDPDCWSSYFKENSLVSRLEPYAGIGVGLAMGSRMKNTIITESVQNNQENTLEIKSKTKFKTAGTLYGELGLKYKTPGGLSVFGELKCTTLSLINSKGRITSYVENGQDQTAGLTPAELETEYFKELDFTETQFPMKPSKQLAERYPASGLCFTVGVLYDIHPGGPVPPANPNLGRGIFPPRGADRKPLPEGIKVTPDERIKAAALNEICKDCPPINLRLKSNNDEAIFPEADIIVKPYGAWGGAQLENLSTVKSVILCETCAGSGASCCCRIDSLNLFLTFKLTLNENKINKGVWMNTNSSDPANFGRTKVGKQLPRSLKHKEDWQKVDRKSVIIHERQHFSDIQLALSETLNAELQKFMVVQYPCTENAKKACEKQVAKDLNVLGLKLKAIAKEAVKEIARAENREYMYGELEIRARTVQAAELNKRQ